MPGWHRDGRPDVSLVDVKSRQVIPPSHVKFLFNLGIDLAVVYHDYVAVGGQYFKNAARIIAAQSLSDNMFVVLSSAGWLSLFHTTHGVVDQRLVAISDEWKDEAPRIVCDSRGKYIAVSLSDSSVAIYTVKGKDLKYLTRVRTPRVKNFAILTIRSQGEILWSCSGERRDQSVHASAAEISDRGAANIAMLPLLSSPQWCVPLSDGDGSVLLIRSRAIELLNFQDMLSGNTSLKRMNMKDVSCVSSHRATKGKLYPFVIDRGTMHAISVVDGYLNTMFVVESPKFVRFSEITSFVVLGPIRGTWVVAWVNQGEARGRFLIETQEDRTTHMVTASCRELSSGPSFTEYYGVKDFVLDLPATQVLGYGATDLSLSVIMKASPVLSILPGGIPAAGVSNVLSVPEASMIIIVRPWLTQTYLVRPDIASGFQFVEFDSYGIQNDEVLAAGIVVDRVIVVARRQIVTAMLDDVRTPASTVGVSTIRAAIGGRDRKLGVFAVQDSKGQIKIMDPSSIQSAIANITLPMSNDGSQEVVSFIKILGTRLMVGTASSRLLCYDLLRLENTGAALIFDESLGIGASISDCAQEEDTIFVGGSDGQLGCLTFHGVGDRSLHFAERFSSTPVHFVNVPESRAIFIRSTGLWTFDKQYRSHPSFQPLPLSSQKGGGHALPHSAIDGACTIPGQPDALLVACNDRLFIFETLSANTPKLPICLRIDSNRGTRSTDRGKVVRVPKHRIWIMIGSAGLLVYDGKHRSQLKLVTPGFEFSKHVLDIALLDVDVAGNLYQHLVVSLSGTQSLSPALRTFSISRSKDTVTLKRGFKWITEKPALDLKTAPNRVFCTHSPTGPTTLYRYELDITGETPRTDSTGVRVLDLKHPIKDVSVFAAEIFISTDGGLYIADMDTMRLRDIEDWTNIRKKCICHLVLEHQSRKLILVADRDTTLTVLELPDDGSWVQVGSLRPKGMPQIMRMQQVPSNDPKVTFILALLNNGSFVELGLDINQNTIHPSYV